MKQFFIICGVFLSRIFILLRYKFWGLLKSVKSSVKLPVTKHHKYRFSTYGELIHLLYAHQFLSGFGKGFEYKTIKKFTDLIRPGDTVLDVGANIGMYSLLSADLVGPTGRVLAFEPVSKTYEALRHNLAANEKKNVRVHQLALSDSNGTAVIKVPDDMDNDAAKDAFNSLDLNPTGGGGEVITTATLDSFRRENDLQKIDFIKIDIEGAELLFFQGARQTLQDLRPKHIVFEAHEPFCKRFNYSVADIVVLLHEYDYEFEQYDDWQWLATAK